MKIKWTIIWIAIWILSLLAAFLGGQQLGKLTIPSTATQSATHADIKGNNSFADTALATSKQSIPEPLASSLSSQSPSTSSEMRSELSLQDQLQDLQINADPQGSMSETVKVYNVIKDLNGEQILALLLTFTDNAESNNIANLLYTRLLELDPILSLNYLADNSQKKNMLSRASEALMVLAKTDPEQALAWYQQNMTEKNADPRNVGLRRIIESFAENDLYAATDVILTMTQKEAESALYGVGRVLNTSQDYSDYLNYLEGFNKPFLMKPVLRSWALTEPEDMAAHLAIKYPAGETGKEHQLLLNTWSMKEPEKAANWYVNMMPSSEKLKAINMIAASYQSRGGHNKTLNWIDQIPDVDTSTAIDTLIRNASYRDIDFSIANLNRISNERVLLNTVRRIHTALERDDPGRADEFKLNSGYGDLLR